MTLRIILIAALQMLWICVNAQTPSNRWRFTISGGLMQGKVKNVNFDDDEKLIRRQKMSTPAQVGFSYRLGKASYLKSGLRLSGYQTEYISQGTFIGSSRQDPDGYQYRPMVTADYTIKSRMNLVSVPIIFEFTSIDEGPVHFSFEIGMFTAFAGGFAFQSEGKYKREGLYPDENYINVNHIVSDIPEYGYGTYGAKDYRLNTRSVLMSAYSSIGYVADITPKAHIGTKVFLEKVMGDVIKKSDRDVPFEDVLDRSRAYEKTTLFGFGAELEISIDLTRRE